MKPLLINTYDTGGAARSCLRLHKGLLQRNIDSKVLVKTRTEDIPKIYKITLKELKSSITDKVRRRTIKYLKKFNLYKNKQSEFLKTRHPNLEKFSFPFSEYDITRSPMYQEAEIINLHWVANFLDYPTFFKRNTKPIVWTLHDENPFTGGEHYKEEIIGMDDNGYPIYRTITKKEEQIFNKILEIKKRALENVKDLTIITPSQWLSNEAKNSELFKKFPVITIPYGIEENIFKPYDVQLIRSKFNLPINKKVVLFVAQQVTNFRKGFVFLLKAIEYLERDDIYLIAVGNSRNLNGRIHGLGFINDDKIMSEIYSAADIFVLPSLIDNLPNTMLESIMCGTPVVAFPAGGIPEVIKTGVNGILAEQISAKALAEAINDALDNLHLFDSKKISSEAVTKFNLDVQAKKYIDLYKQILKKKTL